MRLCLNQDQAEGLYSLICHLLKEYKPENIGERLIEDMIKRVSEKLRKKVLGSFVKEYAIVLSPEEAKAYWLFFEQNTIGQEFLSEKRIVEQQCNQINFTYG